MRLALALILILSAAAPALADDVYVEVPLGSSPFRLLLDNGRCLLMTAKWPGAT